MRGRGAAGLIALALMTTLSACGGDDELVGLDRVGRPDAPNVLRLQLNADYSPQAPTPGIAKGFRELFEQWAREHPEWRIELNIIPSSMSTTEQARLLEKARVGRAPDCANVDSYTVPLFVQQGVLQPIDRYVSRQEVADLFPYVRDVVQGSDGHVYAWWWSTDLRVIYRRKDLVPRAPRNWDELIAFARQASERDPAVDGYLFNGGRWEATLFDNLGYFWMQGGRLLDEGGRPVFAEGANRAKMLEVLRLLKRSVDSGASPSRVATIINYDEFETAAQGGSVAMFLGGSFQYATMEEALGDDMRKWEVSEIPARSGGRTATGTGGWTVGAFTDDPAKVRACMDFVKSVYVGRGNELTGELPTSQRLYDRLETFQRPIYQRFRRYLANGRARPGLAIYPALSNELQIAIGSVLTGSATPEEALDTAGDRVARTHELLAGGGS
jgi:multiple sugar transport system substrate-binding protein